MHIYHRAPLPTTCYIDEAVLWVALGRVPDAFFDEHGEEYRAGEEAKWTGDVSSVRDMSYSPSEFRLVNVDVDYDRYENALSIAYGRTGEEHIEHYLNQFKKAKLEDVDSVMEGIILDSANTGAVEVDWAREQEEIFEPLLDGARVKIFGALKQGRLKAQAWIAFKGVEEARLHLTDKELETIRSDHKEEPELFVDIPGGRFVDIPADEWRLSVDWVKNEMKSKGNIYKAIQVQTDDLFSLFPRPDITPLSAAVSVYPEMVLLEDDNHTGIGAALEAEPRRRGRPRLEGGKIEEVARAHAVSLVRYSSPALVGEALIMAGQEFLRPIFGREVPRSTVQDYIADVVPRSPRKQPENGAGK